QLPLTALARTIAHAPRVGHRREDHAIFLFDPLFVRAASAADDPLPRETHPRRSVSLELEKRRLHRRPEGVVAPASVATDDSMTRNQDRDRIRAERVADGARRARMPDATGQLRIRRRLAIGDTGGVREHARLELAGLPEIERHREIRAYPGE